MDDGMPLKPSRVPSTPLADHSIRWMLLLMVMKVVLVLVVVGGGEGGRGQGAGR